MVFTKKYPLLGLTINYQIDKVSFDEVSIIAELQGAVFEPHILPILCEDLAKPLAKMTRNNEINLVSKCQTLFTIRDGQHELIGKGVPSSCEGGTPGCELISVKHL